MSTSSQADWDSFYNDFYLAAYLPRQEPEAAGEEALAAARLAEIEPGAGVLDCPCGFGRHSIPLARAGYRVVGADRSAALLGEARRRGDFAGDLQFVEADYRELPFDDGAFDAVLCLFTSLGYYGPEEDARALREFSRVLRPGGRLVIEITTRDLLVRGFRPKDWEQSPDGSLFLEERRLEPLEGVVEATQMLVRADGSRDSRAFRVYVYTATELRGLVTEAGFDPAAAYGGLDGAPFTPDTRLTLVAEKPV